MDKNLLVISNNFPDEYNQYSHNIFVKEQVRKIARKFHSVYVISPLAHGISYLRGRKYSDYSFENIHVYFPKYFNIPFFYDNFQFLWSYLETRCVLGFIRKRQLKFHYIHAHFTWPSGVIAVNLKQNFNIPVVITEHSSETFSKAIVSKNFQFIKAWYLCDSIIRVKNSDVLKFLDVGVDLNKVFYVPNGYDATKFYPTDMKLSRKKLNIPLHKKILISVGNLLNVKGHKYLVEAMNYVIKIRKDVICYIVGGGKLEKKLNKQIKAAGLQDYI